MKTRMLKATRRVQLGTRYSRRERKAGRIPAIIYGHKEDPEPILLDAHDVGVELAHGVHVLSVELGGNERQYLIKEVQYDYLASAPVHIDLMRVDLDERVTVRIPVELRGVPKGVSEGGVLDQLLAEVEVECVVTQIPESFRPLVTGLGVGETLFVRDLDLPPGVTIRNDPDDRIAMVRMLAEEPEALEPAISEESAQPEVIGRAKTEEEPAE